VADWHKRYSRDALKGMRGLTNEERGVYNTALDLIYEDEGAITDQALRHELTGCNARSFTRIIGGLIEKGRLIRTADGRLIDERAMFELSMMQADSQVRKIAGSKGGRKTAKRAWKADPAQSSLFANVSANSSEKPNEINEGKQAKVAHAHTRTREAEAGNADSLGKVSANIGQTFAKHVGNSPDFPNDFNGRDAAQLEHIDSDIREESPPLVPPPSEKPRLKSKRAQPLPPAWEPPEPTDRQKEIISAWPSGAYEREIEKFTNNATEKGRTALDWDAAFRNWIINADEFRNRHGGRSERSSGWRF
jgi:hypothetical protein